MLRMTRSCGPSNFFLSWYTVFIMRTPTISKKNDNYDTSKSRFQLSFMPENLVKTDSSVSLKYDPVFYEQWQCATQKSVTSILVI